MIEIRVVLCWKMGILSVIYGRRKLKLGRLNFVGEINPVGEIDPIDGNLNFDGEVNLVDGGILCRGKLLAEKMSSVGAK